MKKKNIYLITIFIVVLMIFVYCGKHSHNDKAGQAHDHDHVTDEAKPASTAVEEPDAHDHEHAADTPGHTHETGTDSAASTPVDKKAAHAHLHFSAAKIKEWGIEFGSPEERNFLEKIKLTGIVKLNKNTTFLINSLVPGVVAAVKKDIGDVVQKGAALCVLNSPALLDIKTRYIKAYQDYLLNKQNYDRAKSLFAAKALERKELISRETKYKTGLADYFSLEAKLMSLGFSKGALQTVTAALQTEKTAQLKEFLSPFYYIPAPIRGKVISRDLTPGERVEQDKTIFEISDTGTVWAIIDVRVDAIQYIDKGKEVEILCDVYPHLTFSGKITAVPEKVDAALRTLKVRVEVDNEAGLLKPEMYVKGAVNKSIGSEGLAVPVSAVVKMSGIDGVFLKETDGFEFKPVQVTGRDAAGFVFVTGLSLQDIIVTKGSFYMKAEYEIQRGGVDEHAGHTH
ncbi:MAG: efflux RND transporter periplasmic adaptor subunit [Candidatus Aminicenantes bacterium]|nr:efflux RND transporter periplasmic adaptor subunit [Candidatus Aminicenantes bacterium]